MERLWRLSGWWQSPAAAGCYSPAYNHNSINMDGIVCSGPPSDGVFGVLCAAPRLQTKLVSSARSTSIKLTAQSKQQLASLGSLCLSASAGVLARWPCNGRQRCSTQLILHCFYLIRSSATSATSATSARVCMSLGSLPGGMVVSLFAGVLAPIWHAGAGCADGCTAVMHTTTVCGTTQ